MQVSEGTISGLPVIAVEGELDRSNVSALQDALSGCVQGGDGCVILDLGECSFIDSGGLAVILWARKEMGEDRVLAFVAVNPRVRRLLEIIGLLQSEGVESFDDVLSAVTALTLAG